MTNTHSVYDPSSLHALLIYGNLAVLGIRDRTILAIQPSSSNQIIFIKATHRATIAVPEKVLLFLDCFKQDLYGQFSHSPVLVCGPFMFAPLPFLHSVYLEIIHIFRPSEFMSHSSSGSITVFPSTTWPYCWSSVCLLPDSTRSVTLNKPYSTDTTNMLVAEVRRRQYYRFLWWR